ncbi:hypothetical protein [Ensifer sp. MJa1]|uniref:hypothetical protein n=1 Tax=Ensifer sp. MJa1 TaxID=2919888 RepID=UPI00300AF0ED
MSKSLARIVVGVASLASFYPVFDGKARAAEWGCQVILCLSNPAGPTQYTECLPPIQKLWRALAKGRPFPACQGIAFQTSRPRYEPYYCNDGYRLTIRQGDRGREAGCISIRPQAVSNAGCNFDENRTPTVAWPRMHDHTRCQRYLTTRPNIRPQPHYIDVTIDGVGKQRVWY